MLATPGVTPVEGLASSELQEGRVCAIPLARIPLLTVRGLLEAFELVQQITVWRTVPYGDRCAYRGVERK